MSSRPVPFRLRWCDAIRDSHLPANAKVVAFVMATYMNARGECWPSRATVARGAGVAPSTVQRMIGEHLAGTWLVPAIAEPGKRKAAGRAAGYRGVVADLTDQVSQAPDRPDESGVRTDLTDLTDFEANLTDQIGHEPEREPREASPQPPTSGGQGSRNDGTNPRAIEREQRIARARRNVCPDCEVGGGMHAVDCPAVQRGDDDIDFRLWRRSWSKDS